MNRRSTIVAVLILFTATWLGAADAPQSRELRFTLQPTGVGLDLKAEGEGLLRTMPPTSREQESLRMRVEAEIRDGNVLVLSTYSAGRRYDVGACTLSLGACKIELFENRAPSPAFPLHAVEAMVVRHAGKPILHVEPWKLDKP